MRGHRNRLQGKPLRDRVFIALFIIWALSGAFFMAPISDVKYVNTNKTNGSHRYVSDPKVKWKRDDSIMGSVSDAVRLKILAIKRALGLENLYPGEDIEGYSQRDKIKLGGKYIAQKPGVVLGDAAPVVPAEKAKITQEQIINGLIAAGFGKSPVATLSGELAEAGNRMPGKADPYAPAIISLMESRGGQDPKPKAAANYYNILKKGQLIDFRGNPKNAIYSNDPKNTLNFAGLLRQGGLYQKYIDSGNIADFFEKYTPASDPLNPTQDELVNRYNTIRSKFVKI